MGGPLQPACCQGRAARLQLRPDWRGYRASARAGARYGSCGRSARLGATIDLSLSTKLRARERTAYPAATCRCDPCGCAADSDGVAAPGGSSGGCSPPPPAHRRCPSQPCMLINTAHIRGGGHLLQPDSVRHRRQQAVAVRNARQRGCGKWTAPRSSNPKPPPQPNSLSHTSTLCMLCGLYFSLLR